MVCPIRVVRPDIPGIRTGSLEVLDFMNMTDRRRAAVLRWNEVPFLLNNVGMIQHVQELCILDLGLISTGFLILTGFLISTSFLGSSCAMRPQPWACPLHHPSCCRADECANCDACNAAALRLNRDCRIPAELYPLRCTD